MAKTFKKNQRIIATLPTGRQVNGIYIEPYSEDGHSFYVNEYDGNGPDGEPRYRKIRYGVKDAYINAVPEEEKSLPSYTQYQSWLKRAAEYQARVDEILDSVNFSGMEEKTLDKLERKLKRQREKLKIIESKIKKYDPVFAN